MLLQRGKPVKCRHGPATVALTEAHCHWETGKARSRDEGKSGDLEKKNWRDLFARANVFSLNFTLRLRQDSEFVSESFLLPHSVRKGALSGRMEIIILKTFVAALLIAVLTLTGTAFAAAPKDKPDKKGILVVAFGTSVPEARKSIDNLVNSAKKAFPDTEVRLAYTSNIIRRKIAKEQKLNIPTPTSALAQMNDEGFTHVYVMPMHIIPGEEYDDIKGLVDGFRAVRGKYEFREIELGKPFLASAADAERMAEILIKRFASELKKPGTGIVLMGHGTPHHPAHAMYSQLQVALDKKAPGRFFIGTVEAEPEIDEVITRLKGHREVRSLVLSPLMIVAGDHAHNDLAGKDDPESWLNRLKKAGYKDMKEVLVGLGEDEEMAKDYVKKLKEMMK